MTYLDVFMRLGCSQLREIERGLHLLGDKQSIPRPFQPGISAVPTLRHNLPLPQREFPLPILAVPTL